MSKNINPSSFKSEIEGDSTDLFVLENKAGIKIYFTNYGQRIVALHTPDKNGNMEDIVLGCNTLEGYGKPGTGYFGATIGRYANRIAAGKFSLDGVTYTLAQNNGTNNLHGGNKGFDSVVWDADMVNDQEIQFSRTSPDGEEGFPGNLTVKVRYALTDSNELQIFYEATTDKKTIVNLTHHSFFNLKGEGNGNIESHLIEINADHYTPVDENLIPTGALSSVVGTPMDFRVQKSIGQDINENFNQLDLAGGYDHNYVLNSNPTNTDSLTFAARVIEPESGRTMEVYTNEPGIQFYSGNFMDGSVQSKNGNAYVKRGAFCLETQHFPNSPNQDSFPSTVLNPGEKYTSVCVYKFGIVE
ncbi:galactose mutarotase [Muricauda sp. 2012CJ35-5]|uniref:Aldose 1-epimerase n=1 Tax=Flagellimonas spongiicola TaxID=2942208 RepID=A0ABT0PYQ8_9FLAO|nr:aldose epimerase family protein [Allomuricauda spongiicola]MCL6275593.1 galactose mutarotase [Allomuricauda spongiicola]